MRESTGKMSDVYTIYHNPRCAKSRLTLKLLRRKCAHVDIVKYLETPPSNELLLVALKALGRKQMLRQNEGAYREFVYRHEKSLQDDALAGLMHEHPSMMQRPLVVAPDGRMAMGRPPENVEAIIS